MRLSPGRAVPMIAPGPMAKAFLPFFFPTAHHAPLLLAPPTPPRAALQAEAVEADLQTDCGGRPITQKSLTSSMAAVQKEADDKVCSLPIPSRQQPPPS